MIAYLNGILAEIEEENIVIEVNGIGYNVRIPAGMAGRLPQIGEVVKLYTYTSVREDAIGLYGFLSRDDLNMYRQLITVSGIGPKGGLSVLSAMSADELRMAVISQDAKAIAKAPGVGTKTAQRIILELKDKISLEDTAMMREVNQVPQYADGQKPGTDRSGRGTDGAWIFPVRSAARGKGGAAGNSGSGCGSPVKGGPEKNVLKRNRQAGCFTCGRHKSAMLFSPAAA